MKTISQPTFWFRLGCGGSALSLLTLVLAFPAQAQAPLDPARLERLLAEGRAAHEQSVAASTVSTVRLDPVAPQPSAPLEDPSPTALPYAPELWAHFPLLITLLDPEVAIQLEQALAQLEVAPDLAFQPDAPLPTEIPVDPNPVDPNQLRIQRLLAEGAAAHAEHQRAQSSHSGVEAAQESAPNTLLPDTLLIASTAPLATASLGPQVDDVSLAAAPPQAPAANQLRIQRLLEEGAAAHAGLTAQAENPVKVLPSRETLPSVGSLPSPPRPKQPRLPPLNRLVSPQTPQQLC
ncbi:MAG: hypothetical protein HC924_10155 [Synechococcaceae cyanobacterium SM2_3_2]|nr:hypothetical protein [Synechococcaceae cyanobacterium SM2_3_2]